MTDHEASLRAAHEAVHRAAQVTRAVQRELSERHAIRKDDDSPVTIADFAAQAVVHRVLRDALGPQRFLAEEHSGYLRDPARVRLLLSAVNAARLVWPDCTGDAFLESIDQGLIDHDHAGDRPERFWTLDPIDGTRGFIRGKQYSVCLALIEHGRVALSALACPNLSSDQGRSIDDPDPHGVIFLASADGPVRVAPCDQPPGRASVVDLPAHAARGPGEPIRLCGSHTASRDSESAAAKVIARLAADGLAVVPPSRLDSQVKYGVVARGQMDVFLRMPRFAGHEEHIWDHAAGYLVASRAGVTVTDCLGQPLNFAQGSVLKGNRGLLVAWPEVHRVMLPAVRAVLAEGG